ncbi:MAG: pyruvate dehydrogenase (acetyl-transferring) E1 component subunit alpha [Thermodesulfobacteriota bacterium]
MPRRKIDLPYHVEHLSILNENGEIDKALEPDIPGERLLNLHQAMLLARRFDERMLALQRQGRIGTFAPVKGQEAAQLGAVALLRPSDWLVPCFRETAAELWRGKPMEAVLLQYAGYNEAATLGEKGNNLPNAVPVATQVLHAVGIGYSIKYRKKDDVVMVFFGDGATSEGDFHEGMNFAGVFQVPVIFVCQNNHWAISVPLSRQTHSRTLAQKALAYDIPGIQVDGNDILAVYVAADEAVQRARAGGGPTMIECVTYRLMMHTTADDPKKYRKEEEVEPWLKRDPLPRLQNYLKAKGLLSDDGIKQSEEAVKAQIQAAVDRAEDLMKKFTDPLLMFEHAYQEMPAYLKEQQQELIQELSEAGKEGVHG